MCTQNMSRVMSLLSTAAEISLLDAAELASDDLIACSAWMVRVSLLKSGVFTPPINIGH